MATVQTRDGKQITIDNSDVPLFLSKNWYYNQKTGYVFTVIYLGREQGKPKHTSISLHRFLLGAPKGSYVDHKDFDKLNYSRSNLRVCTPQESACHTRSIGPKLTLFKGIYFHPSGSWIAKITYKGKTKYLGSYKSQKAAAAAYDLAATEIHAEFASLNFPGMTIVELKAMALRYPTRNMNH